MGHVQGKLEIGVLLSNHNSVNDDLDLVRWEWLKKDINDLVQRYFGEPKEIAGYVTWEVDDLSSDHDRTFYLDTLNAKTRD